MASARQCEVDLRRVIEAWVPVVLEPVPHDECVDEESLNSVWIALGADEELLGEIRRFRLMFQSGRLH
eukprot:465661-Amphidinium_carterae.1